MSVHAELRGEWDLALNRLKKGELLELAYKCREQIFAMIPEFRIIFDDIQIKESDKIDELMSSGIYTDGITIYINTNIDTACDYRRYPDNRIMMGDLLHTFFHIGLGHPYDAVREEGDSPRQSDIEVNTVIQNTELMGMFVRYDYHGLWHNTDETDFLEQLKQMKNKIEAQMQLCIDMAMGYGDDIGFDVLRQSSRKSNMSYKELIRNCVEVREKAHETDEEIDYAWYTYGRQLYGNIPIIEAPEQAEQRVIDDIVIVIDISGSCTFTAPQFLTETLKLIDEVCGDGTRVNIRVMQADTKIRKEFVIHSNKDIPGKNEFIFTGGGTNFRCVFDRIDKLRKEGELKKISALIFFSDGFAGFTNHAPDYKVYCVMDKSQYNINTLPEWIERAEYEAK